MRAVYSLALLAAASAHHLSLFVQSASEVATKDELQSWLSTKEQEIRTKMPAERQDFAVRAVQQEYRERLAELVSEQAPKTAQLPSFLFLESASKYRSVGELDEWKERQTTLVKQSVPAPYQPIASDAIEQEYSKRVAAIKSAEAEPAGCCFEIGFGDMMKPCCLKTWEVQSRASCSEEQRMGGLTAFTKGSCPATAEEAATIAQKPAQLAQTLPVLQLNAEEFKTEAELQGWKAQQLAQIEKYVPEGYRHVARDSIESEFATRVVAVEAPPAELAASAQGSGIGGSSLPWLAVPTLGAVALFVAAHRRRGSNDRTEPLLEHAQA